MAVSSALTCLGPPIPVRCGGRQEPPSAVGQSRAFFVTVFDGRDDETLCLRIEEEFDPADMAAIPRAGAGLLIGVVVVNDCAARRAAPRHWHREVTKVWAEVARSDYCQNLQALRLFRRDEAIPEDEVVDRPRQRALWVSSSP